MKTEIFHAKSIKEAKKLSYEKYGDRGKYIKPHSYASKGNNFYYFEILPLNDLNNEIIEGLKKIESTAYANRRLIPSVKCYGLSNILDTVQELIKKIETTQTNAAA